MPLRTTLVLVVACAVSLLARPLRYPDMGTGQIRLENHLMPAVSTGPLDPAWSPDGRWIAFSARGDIWKVSAEGGEAIALTEGPAYHFEPAWSPDGRQVAFSMDQDGNLDIGVVDAGGGTVRRLTEDPHVDVQPAWTRDGQRLLFVSGRTGSLDIYSIEVASRAEHPLVSGPGDQLQPAVSPDGRTLAFIAPVEGRLGSGGIWAMPLDGGTPALIHYEETSYRAKPAWTPDGLRLLYVSDEGGSNGVAIVPAKGGNPIILTADPMDEYAPAPSPDGSAIAFVSNREGPTKLILAPWGGGRTGEWREVPIQAWRPRRPWGTVRVTVLDAAGQRVSARIHVRAADGRAYAPADGFHRVISVTETHYFHTTGAFELQVPAGAVRLEALKGFEYRVANSSTDVPAGGSVDVTLRLARAVDAPARGWYSGDTHIHDLHQGRFGLTQRHMFEQAQAEDLRVTNALIHMDGTRLMGRWNDLTGAPHPLSTRDYILYYSEEFRGSFGHVGLLGLKRFILPFIGGTAGTSFDADVLNARYLEEARDQGGIGGFLHPYNRDVKQPSDAAGSEIPIDVALGHGDFYDVVCIWSDELASAGMYYRMLNAGFRLAATGGSDNFANVWRDPPPGTGRTYARIEGRFTFESWMAAVKAGRTFGTNGPLVFLEVEGRGPGEELAVAATAPAALKVQVEARSLAPLDRVELIVNGEVARTAAPAGDGTSITFSHSVDMVGSGWIAARAIGTRHKYVADSYPFAHTSPVYVVRNGVRFTSTVDARFLANVVDEIWKRVEARNSFHTDADRQQYRQAVDKARAVYQRIANGGKPTAR